MMQIAAVLEIAPDSSGGLPTRLLAAAYQASAAGYVMFVLRGVSPQAVDRVLDPLVTQSRNWRLNGVVYSDARDAQFVCAAAKRACIVVAGSQEFRAQLEASEIPYIEPGSALERLTEFGRGVGVAVPASAAPSPAVPTAGDVVNA